MRRWLRWLDAATRDGYLADLADDELIGVLRAWRRLESWSSAGTLAAAAELARRRPAGQALAAAPGQFPAQLSEFVGDEIAAALTLSGPAASVLLDLALDLATRLPAATRRREEAQKDPRVRRWQQDAGTAALAGYALPPAEVLQAGSASPAARWPCAPRACPAPWKNYAPGTIGVGGDGIPDGEHQVIPELGHHLTGTGFVGR